MTGALDFADLEIRLFEKTGDGYPIELSLNHAQQLRGKADSGLPEWLDGESAAQFGEKLFGWLLADAEIRDGWNRFRGQFPQRRVRLRIDAGALELQAIAWEQLRDVVEGLDLAAGEATPFSRYLAGPWQTGAHVLKRPIKVLVAIANPVGLSRFGLTAIDVEQEWPALEAAITAAVAAVDVDLTLLPQPCTLSAIETELKKGYHVLHLMCHGSFSERQSRASLYLADESNNVDFVYEDAFAGMLQRQVAEVDIGREDRLRLVFLASCETAKVDQKIAFRGMAQALVGAGVPAVIAMQDLVPIATARHFAQVFYRQLLRHGLIDLAANEARSSIITAGLPGAVIPVVYCRLKDGRLFGRRGSITSDNDNRFWSYLLENIEAGMCIPFLGPRITNGLLIDRAGIAEKLAEKHDYPLDDRHDLSRVAQFIALGDPDTLRRDYARELKRSLFTFLDITPDDVGKRMIRDDRATLSSLAEYLKWSERVQELQENEIHHLLAGLPFPVYFTTGFDNLMTAALSGRPDKQPRRLGLRWRKPDAGTPQWILTPPATPQEPVVINLNGHDGDGEQYRNVVLAEDDYLSHFVRLSRDQEFILPSDVLRMLADSSYLFLGYQIEDWEFRVVLRGLIAGIAQSNAPLKQHVGVQLSPVQTQDPRKVEDYLKSYLTRNKFNELNIDIYWGTPQQFVSDLAERWQRYQSESVV